MRNWQPEDPNMYEDVQTRWQYENTATNKSPQARLRRLWRASRDSARTPVQWTGGKNAGFTDGETPWFHINPNYTEINVEAQETDPHSLLNFYRKAIALRKRLSCVRHGSYREYRKHSGKLFVYSMEDRKQKILVVCSFSEKAVPFRMPRGFDPASGTLVLGNYDTPDQALRPYETQVWLWDQE